MEEALKAAEVVDPRMGVISIMRGDRALAQGHIEQAIKFYQHALDVDRIRIEPEAEAKLSNARRMLEEQTQP